MAWLVLGIVVFIGMHSLRLAAPEFRENMVARLGIGPWKGIYSLLSLIGLAAIIWGYGIARQDPVFLYYPPYWLSHLTALLMFFALVLAVSSDLPTGRIKQAVKHPLLIGTKTWAVAHLLVNGDLASVLLFGGLLVWAVIALIKIKRRGDPDPVATSSWSDFAAIAIGAALWAAIVWWLHEWLIGIPAIA